MTLHDLLKKQSIERPKAVALVYQGHSWTYADLERAVERFSAVLTGELNVKTGDSVGLIMRNCPEFIIAFFAAARIGARAVPVNFLLKADEISFIFDHAGVVVCVTQSAFLSQVRPAKPQVASLRHIVLAGPAAETAQEGTLQFKDLIDKTPDTVGNFSMVSKSDEIVMLIYTSGTTGKPKGVMLTHRNFISNAEQSLGAIQLYSKDVFLCLLPMFHSFAWTTCVVVPIVLGARIVIVESIQPFGEVLKLIMRHRVTLFVAVPPIFAAVTQRVPFWRPLKFLNPVRASISGAAAMPGEVHRGFESKFGIPLLEGYGLTEASPVVSLNPLKAERVLGSVGPPLPGVTVGIFDESGKRLGSPEVGEICVKGPNVMLGYYKDAEATTAAFLSGPDLSEREWLRTGDLGWIDQAGYLYISDRKKDLIIVKGLNVYPKEVEEVLLSDARVAEAAVIGIPDNTGDEIIRAYVVLHPDQTLERNELLKLCRAKLANYKCPKDLEIRPELPKNAIGKILKRQLREEARTRSS